MKKFLIILLAAVLCLNVRAYAALPEIKAQGAILVDADTGIVIYSKNANLKLYPASITKLMTVLLALEYAGGNYGEDVYFSRNAVFSLPYDSSNIAMNDEETLTLEQSLYAIMLASANEVANAVAEHIAGSTEEFALMMSKRAKELGCVRTNFMNPHGLHEEDHYTCAYDMSLIMRECVKYPDFLKLISSTRYEIPPTQKQPEVRVLNNTNKMIYENGSFYYEDVVGGKTGFTDEAGHTLVTFAQRGNTRLICVVMKTAKNEIYTDTAALLDYGFEQYAEISVFEKSAFSASLPVLQDVLNNESAVKIGVMASRDIKLNLPAAFMPEEVEQKVILPDKMFAPVEKGEKVGRLVLSYQGMILAEVDLLADASVDLPPAMEAVIDDTPEEEALPGEEPVIFGNTTITIAVVTALIIVVCIAVRVMILLSRRRRLYRRRNLFLKSGLSKRYRYKNQ